jgi:glycosyltransferase involved in cell wall biosynthesis
MRVLMVNHEFTITGSSTAFFRLARHLQSQGHDITIVPVIADDGPMKTRFEAAGFPVTSSVALANFDLAIASTICSAGVVLKIGAALPTIWFVNEAEVALNILLKSPALAQAFHLAAAVIYNMPFQHEIFKSFTYNADQSKFHTCSFGVDINAQTLAREKVPAKTRAFRSVQVGTIEPRKRPGDVIRAAAASRLDMECIVIGKFFQIDEAAQNLINAEPEKYKLLENLPDEEVLAWVESADMFCLASGSETQSLSAYEAALLARPLLLSDLPCYTDVFRHGRNCLMVPPGHIELLSLSMQVYAASANLRAQLGAAAQATAKTFSNAKFFAKFDTIMNAVTPNLQNQLAN